MAKAYLEDTTLTEIGSAIREKTGGAELLLPSEMPGAIRGIQGGGSGNASEWFTSEFNTTLWKSIKKMPKFTFNGTDLAYAFQNGENLIEFDFTGWDTSNVTDMRSMFANCKNVIDLDISNFDMCKVSIVSGILNNCSKLKNLIFGKNLGKSYTQKSANYVLYTLDISYCTNLTHDSLISVINGLYDLNLVYSETLYPQSLVLGTTNLAKLTAEELAIATNKGWTIS